MSKSRERPTRLSVVRREIAALGDPKRAKQQQAYMKSAMPYHGVASGPLRALCKELFADFSPKTHEDWENEVRAMWDGARFREERYAALSLCAHRAARTFQTPDAMPLYEKLIAEGAWWDYVDDIAVHRVGPIVLTHPKPMKALMRRWSTDDSMWKRRTSIICQVAAHDAIDLELLYACIEPSLSSKEFFLRKAIGWSLREHAWRDGKEIKRYVRENDARLSGLSKREALKNL